MRRAGFVSLHSVRVDPTPLPHTGQGPAGPCLPAPLSTPRTGHAATRSRQAVVSRSSAFLLIPSSRPRHQMPGKVECFQVNFSQQQRLPVSNGDGPLHLSRPPFTSRHSPAEPLRLPAGGPRLPSPAGPGHLADSDARGVQHSGPASDHTGPVSAPGLL